MVQDFYEFLVVGINNNRKLSSGSDLEKLKKLWTEGKADYIKAPEYSRVITPQIRQAGNRLSGLAETAYASLLA